MTIKKIKSSFLPERAIIGDIDVLVCSMGGVGTTFLMTFLRQYFRLNNRLDMDGLKHLDRPPLVFGNKIKALYIYGNPINATLSLFRREIQHQHSSKTLANYPDLDPISEDETIDFYFNKGVDRLKFAEHFDNWSNPEVNYPIMLLKYENIWDNLPQIFKFLNIPSSELDKFPDQKERNSSFNQLSSENKDKAEKMYGDLQRIIENCESIKIIETKVSNYKLLNKYLLFFVENPWDILISLLKKLYRNIKLSFQSSSTILNKN